MGLVGDTMTCKINDKAQMINIIFDTNASRDFVAGVGLGELEQYAENIASRFNSKGLKLSVSPVVIQELLYHLVDSNDKDFSVSFKAIKAMMLVQEYQRKDGVHAMMSPSELLIANEIYHMRSESRELMYSQLMTIAMVISHGDINHIPDLHTIDGGTVKTYVDDIESGFATQIREVCQSVEFMSKITGKSFEEELNTEATEISIVTYFSRTTYNLLMNEGKLPDYHLFQPPFLSDDDERLRKYMWFTDLMMKGNKEIIRRYPAFLKLFKEVIRRIHQSNNQISDERLKNYVWDISLMFHVNDHTVNHEPFRFITTDKAMLLASGAFRNSNNVMNYGEFHEWLMQNDEL